MMAVSGFKTDRVVGRACNSRSHALCPSRESPAPCPQLSAPARRRPRTMASYAGRVLVIEDEYHTRVALRTSLERNGYLTLEASSGSDGLTQCFAEHPQVVLLDLGLP